MRTVFSKELKWKYASMSKNMKNGLKFVVLFFLNVVDFVFFCVYLIVGHRMKFWGGGGGGTKIRK